MAILSAADSTTPAAAAASAAPWYAPESTTSCSLQACCASSMAAASWPSRRRCCELWASARASCCCCKNCCCCSCCSRPRASLAKRTPRVFAAWTISTPQRWVGRLPGGSSPRGSSLLLAVFKCWPDACANLRRAVSRAPTCCSSHLERIGVASSAYMSAQSSAAPMRTPTSGTVRSQQTRAQAMRRYMAGASGQPWRTPASHRSGGE